MTQPRQKPKLRGVSHQFAFVGYFIANTILLGAVEGTQAKFAVWIYAASLAYLFGVSTVYHRVHWSKAGRRRMRSLDHSGIFILLGGSYTPLFMLLLPPGYDGQPLLVLWLMVALGVIKSLAWIDGPKWVTSVLVIAAGWSVAYNAWVLGPQMGFTCVALLYACGAAYSVGAVIYLSKRPDPIPTVFGYHEVFHIFVILASLLHYGHVILVLKQAGAL